MEADLELINPASVGWCDADDCVPVEAFLRGMVTQERDKIFKMSVAG
jgi:hypothetical protein